MKAKQRDISKYQFITRDTHKQALLKNASEVRGNKAYVIDAH